MLIFVMQYFSIFNYLPGERIKVETHIENSSSRALKLKFKLEQKQTFFAKSRRKHITTVIFKAVEDPIPSRSKKTFTSRLRIPSNLDITIPDCNIIKVEYMLKVIMFYLIFLMVPICSSMCVLISLIFHAFLSFLRCIWIFPMLEIQRLYFQWSLSQQASSAFHSKAKQVSKPVRTRVNQYGQVLHFNQHLFLCPMFLLLLPLDQRRIYTQAYTLIQPIQTNHHLLIQTSFQTQIHQHKESAQLYYPSVLHHTPLWILHLLITTIHHSIQAPQYTGKVQQVQSIILLNRLHYQNCIHHHHHFQCHTKWY